MLKTLMEMRRYAVARTVPGVLVGRMKTVAVIVIAVTPKTKDLKELPNFQTEFQGEELS